MSPRLVRYLQFGAASVVAWVTIGFGCQILARMDYRDEALAESLSEILRYLQPLWQAFELLPCLLLGAVSASLAQQSFGRGIGLFVVGLLAYSTIYYFGYMSTEAYMLRRAWTAASLSAGFIPLKCMGVLLVAFIARIFLGRLRGLAKA